MFIKSLLLLMGCLLTTGAIAHQAPASAFSKAALAQKQWVLQDREHPEQRRYRIPADLHVIQGLPANERKRLLAAIRLHDDNQRTITAVAKKLETLVERKPLSLPPEYRQHLDKIALSIEPQREFDANPLHAHEPILRALPGYTHIHVFTPVNAVPRVRDRLAALGLGKRAHVVVQRSKTPASGLPASRDKSAPWIHDTAMVARAAGSKVLLTPLAFGFENGNVLNNDLAYLAALGSGSYSLLRSPLFFRAGNILSMQTPDAGLTLFVGETELFVNAAGFASAIGLQPSPDIFTGELAKLTGASTVVLMPNSDRLFHIDQYMAVLDDRKVALIEPLDPELVPVTERRVLETAQERLARQKVEITRIPTVSERIAAFQSPVNIVPFIHRETGQRTALLPMFPDRPAPGLKGSGSLNEMILAAYRKAGIATLPLEDRFYPLMGNTHCAVLVLQ